MRKYLAVLVVGLVAVGVSVIPARSALAATVFIATGSQPIQNRNSGDCMVIVPTSTQTFVDSNPCFQTQIISYFAQTSVPPASIPGHVYHQLAASPAGVPLSPGTPANGCLDVPDQRSGSPLIVTPCANVTAGQFWTVIPHHDNTFLYANLGSGKCMAQQIADPLFTKTGPVFQTNCDESSAVWMNAV